MGPRTAILGGLVAGIVVGGLLLVALVAFLPAPAPGAATPAPGAPSASASPSDPPQPPSTPGGTGTGTQAPDDGTSPAPTPRAGDAAFHVGEPAPPLAVPLLGGGSIELAQLRGRPVWLVFMATWCPTCVDELPQMNAFAARYAETGLVVAAIDVGEPAELVAGYMETIGVLFPVGLDEDGRAAEAWGVVVPPIHFFVDAQGIVRAGALGGIGPDVMAASLRTILPGVDVQP